MKANQFSIKASHVIFAVIFLVLPFILRGAYMHNILVVFGIYCLLAMSVNIVVGYMGEVTLGTAAFFGIGAYTSALLGKTFGLSFLLSAPCGMILAGLVGLLLGYITLRLSGPYFAITTLVFAEIIKLISTNWVSLTRGPMGLTQIPFPTFNILGIYKFRLTSEVQYYYFIFILVVIALVVINNFIKSPSGRALLAQRDHKDLARSVGINATNYRLLAFIGSTMLAGLAGAVYAHHFRILSPENLAVYYSALPLLMVFIGGKGLLFGPLVGAAIFSALPEILRIAEHIRMAIFSALLIITITFMPDGIVAKVNGFFKKSEARHK